MQATGEQQDNGIRFQRRGTPAAAAAGGESMSRNGSSSTNGGGFIGAGSKSASPASQPGDVTAAPGPRLKIRLGGGGSGSNSSAGGSRHSPATPLTPVGTPRAAAAQGINGSSTTAGAVNHDSSSDLQKHSSHGAAGVIASSQNGTAQTDESKSKVMDVDLPRSLKIKLVQQNTQDRASLEPQSKQKEQELQHAEDVVEDEQAKQRRAEQLAQDLAELPNVAHQSLVPLYELVRRLVAHSYTELQSIVEVLPSQSDFDRKRTIIEYVITTRRQIVKLLVLLRWAKDNTQDTERSMNLIAFLQRQNFQLERAVQALKGVEGLLAGARVRNYDLITAVEVLTTGTYAQLPSLFTDSFIPPPKLTNAAVIALLQDLESVIRLRLQLYEHIPVQLLQRPYRIHDGRVTFRCPGYFNAAFTLGGDKPTDQWYLVDFSFDLEGRDVQARPSGAMREHIMQVCNTKLAECAAEEKEKYEAKEDLASDSNQRGTALVQAFTVLQDLCVNYQLELWHYHAIQANNTPTVWQGMLAVSLSKDRQTLELKNQALSQGPLPTPHQPPELRYEEMVTITIMETPLQNRKGVSARLTELAERLGTAKKSSALPEPCDTTIGPEDAPRVPTKSLQCLYSREVTFIDSRGKRVAAPIQRKVDLRKTEKTIDLQENSKDGKASLRDLELILSQCFALKANILPSL